MTDSKARNLANLLADGAIGSNEIADGAITNAKLAPDAVPDLPEVLKPTLVSPINGATGIGDGVTLVAGPYLSLYGRTHAFSRFQVSDTADFSNIVYDSGEIAATTSHTLPLGNLQDGETQY